MTLLREIQLGDGAQLDAFGNQRVSQGVNLFDNQFTYNLSPLLFEQITSANSAISHNAVNRSAALQFTGAGNGETVAMQSYLYIPYQPGKSQGIDITFNFNGATANVDSFAKYGDADNFIEFRVVGNTSVQFRIGSTTSNGGQSVTQDAWNIDKLDGTGASGITLDLTKTQIFHIDLQALYVGRVRLGFVIDGKLIYCHEFDHANKATYPYIATANLPVRVGMTTTGASVTKEIRFICARVQSEGGRDDDFGYEFGYTTPVITAANGTRTHAFSLRPKKTFNSITNRCSVGFIELELLVTGNSPVLWELCIGQALTTPTYADVNTLYSSSEVVAAATLSGNPAIVIDSGFVAATNTVKGASTQNMTNRYPITLNAAGLQRDLGTLTLLVQGIGGASTCYAAVKFKEIR